ncbi:MAG: hypothetical protein QM680_00255 [Luteolibacter sp.]
MKALPSSHRVGGFSLVEVALALGVLAMMVPVMMGAMARSLGGADRAAAESRSLWMVPACCREIDAVYDGVSEWFELPESEEEATFPPIDDWKALAFSSEGKILGKIELADYERGSREIDGMRVAAIARIDRFPSGEGDEASVVKISIETPAAGPAEYRARKAFFVNDGR